jgi:hypothetical protein
LGAVAGTWFYGLEFTKSENLALFSFGMLLFLFFVIFLYGLAINYIRLNDIYTKLKEFENGTN